MDLATMFRDSLVCGIVSVNGSDNVTTLNQQAREILGLTNTAQYRILADLPASIRDAIHATRVAKREVVNKTLEIRPEAQPAREIWYYATPTLDSGPSQGVTLILNDVASENTLAARLQRLDRLANIGTLSSSLAHEMKNALVAGRTFIEVLIEKHPDAEFSDLVRREFQRLELLLNQMLKWAGTGQPAFVKVRVHQALDHALRLVEHPCKLKDIATERTFRATRDIVVGNEGHIEQLFLNLFLNALDAMNEPGKLRVATTNDANRLLVSVSDTGSGMSPELIDRVFEPFMTTKEGGTGLGLSISRRIVLNHGGEITAANLAGGGAVFTVALPAD